MSQDVRPEPDAPAPAARWCVGTRLVVAAAVLWAGFVLVHRPLSGRLWLWLVVDTLPPLAYLVVPVLLLGLAPLARPAWRLVSGLAVLALLAGAGLAGVNLDGVRHRADPGAAGIRVLSWNSEYWDQGDDPARFVDYLRRQRADVYLLQEYIHFDDARHVATPIDELAALRRAFPGYQVVARGELVTLSRFPVVGQPLVGPDRATPDEGTPAGWLPLFERAKVLRTDLRVGGTTVSFYNVHIPVQFDLAERPTGRAFWRTVHAKAAARRAQVDGLVAAMRGNRGPVLVAGDFNSTAAMGDLRRVAAHGRDAAEAGGPLLPLSWPAAVPALWRLDWAFTEGDVTALDYRIGDAEGLSDHRPQQMLLSVGSGR